MVNAEQFHRDGIIDKCLDQYKSVAKQFEGLNDYKTASYFYNKCLDVSMEAKSLKGQAEAFKGLGICEEQVFNKYEAMHKLEIARDKAVDGSEPKLEKEIWTNLVRVY